jgi:hypothetical protein
MSTNRNDQLIADYMRARARVNAPPDLLVPVRAGIATAPQAHRSWFAALLPAGITALAVALVVALVALVGLRPNLVGPSASASAGPSVAMDQKPALRTLTQETNDFLTSIHFYLGRLNGRTLYEETLTGPQLGEEAWFGPFGTTFLRVGVDGRQWTLDVLTADDPTPRRIHADDARITAVTASSDGAWVYLSRADTTGADLGTWRLPATGGDLTQVLAPDAQRPTPPRLSGTVFFWTPDGTQLLVQHCRGERLPGDDCTWTAIAGPTGEVLREITPSAPAGIVVGIANDSLLAGADCDGISCDASLVDFATGEVTDVDLPGARETLIDSAAGPILLTDEGSTTDGYVVTATELDSGRTWTAYQTQVAIVQLVTLERGAGGVQLDPGWFAVASEGQLGPVQLTAPVLVHALDGQTFEMGNLVPEPSPSPAAATSPPAQSPQPSGIPFTIVCRDVPEDLCHAYAEGTVAGPQPSGAAEVIEVTVTCEVNAPCAADRLDSGGQVIIRYADGATWSQDWSPGAGVSSR